MRIASIWDEWILPTVKASRLVRQLTPWWVVNKIAARKGMCPTSVVMWKYFGSDGWDTWGVHGSCWDGPGEGWDYCGKWQDYATFKADTGRESYRPAR